MSMKPLKKPKRGRKPGSGTYSERLQCVSILPGTTARLAAEAHRRGCSVAALVRAALAAILGPE